MSTKKLLLALAPLIVAVALVPAAASACTAPACPHVYPNGSKAVAGKKVKTMGWGTIVLKNAFLTSVECKNVAGGYSENPVTVPAGGAAKGVVQAFYAYECVSEGCIKLGGKNIEAIPENLPWTGETTEAVPGVFRAQVGKPPKTPKVVEPGEVIVRVNCYKTLPTESVSNTQFYGENSPHILTASCVAIGSLPCEAEFDQPGSGSLNNENIGIGTTEGTIKGQGYLEQELIETKNP